MRPRETSPLVRLIDVLCSGASPPGMIDMVRDRHAHLRRRFAMIARHDGKSGRWSTAGLVVSLLIGAVALTGAVRGQSAQPDAPSQPASGAPTPQPEAQPAAGGAESATAPQPASRVSNLSEAEAARLWEEKYAARSNEYILAKEHAKLTKLEKEYLEELKSLDGTREAGGAKSAASPQPARRATSFSAADAAKLWDEKYANRLYYIDGRIMNREAVDREYVQELSAAAGSEAAANRLLRQLAARRQGKGDDARPRPPAPAAGQPEGPAALHDEDADAAVLALLDRKVPELNFDGAPLSDVLDFVRDASDLNLVVEWGTLENAGVDRNTPVSLRVRDVTVAHALELILGDAGRGSVTLGYTIDRNVVRVATGEALGRYTDIRAYDVRDVVPAEMPMEDLKKLVTEAVAPDSWREVGGSVGAVHTSRHKLIVTQTPMNHRQIREILQMLREEPQDAPRAADAASAAQGPARQAR